MLESSSVVACAVATDLDRARLFYVPQPDGGDARHARTGGDSRRRPDHGHLGACRTRAKPHQCQSTGKLRVPAVAPAGGPAVCPQIARLGLEALLCQHDR